MNVLSIVLIILFFGLLIAIHEFGHFIAAKTLGVKVNEFAIGMGPKLLHKEKGETLYTLRAFPIGGFCAMEGEGESSDDPRAFGNKAWWKKLIILVAGAFMNFVAGVVIIVAIFLAAGSPSMPVVTGFMAGAEDIIQTGLQPGDQIWSIDGHRIYFQTDASIFLSRAGEQVDLVVLRDGEKVDLGTIDLSYRQLTDENGNQVTKRGIYIGQFQEDTPLTLLRNSWYQAVDYVRMVWMGLGDLITGAVGLNDMSGVIGIVAVAGDVGQAGAEAAGLFGLFINILDFTALIAINLAVMNLLPIPALDGGQILFVFVGGIYRLFTRKKINEKYLGYVNAVGFFCLIALMVVVAVNDVIKLF
ncbi:M50 family metallopeptidase [uncultured Flavonifractor sp.]|uniref:M50 family metallopeptidase n=1 Tax=uncultured Flavonifractor sp. TaxID=1193534 RepID=UPI00261FD0A9|nr:site-2 protease family protein [uncultured Flavonifractor sp.]